MTESRNHRPHRKQRFLSGCLVLTGTGLLMALVAWIMLGVLSEKSNEALRAKGYPTTLGELDDWYVTPPAGENAADYFLEAGILLERSSFPDLTLLPIVGDAASWPLGTPMPDDMREVVGAYLSHESSAFDLLDEGAQFENARYPVNLNLGPTGMLFAHLKSLRYSVRGQKIRTLYFSGQADTVGLMKEYETLVSIARSLRAEPTLIACMVHVAIVQMTVETVEPILNENALTHTQLEDLDASLARLLDEDVMLRAIVGEFCLSANFPGSPATVPVIGNILQSDYSKTMTEYIEVLESGLPDALDTYQALTTRRYSSLRQLSSRLAPSLARSIQSYYEMRARIMAARAAVAVQIYRVDGGELPERLDAFPKSVRSSWPIDPFSGEPLIYKRLDEGFLVYSVGGDFVDSGGRTQEELYQRNVRGRTDLSGDVVIRILK